MSYNSNFRPQYGREKYVDPSFNQRFRPNNPPSLIEMIEQLSADMDEIKRLLHQIQAQLHNQQNNGPLLQLPNVMANNNYQRPVNNEMLYPSNNAQLPRDQ